MKVHTYHPGNAEQHAKLGKILRELPENKNGYLIKITRNNPNRSIDQNSYYWVILQIISISTGEFDRERLHAICKRKFNSEVVTLPSGDSEVIPLSTTDLDTAQFTAYVKRVKSWAESEFGIIIPEQRDITHKLWMEIENSYDETFQG